jgi:hypothetical protein
MCFNPNTFLSLLVSKSMLFVIIFVNIMFVFTTPSNESHINQSSNLKHFLETDHKKLSSGHKGVKY